MSRDWFNQQERSSSFWINLIRWIALKFGRPVARLILYPITLYFLIFSVRARKASKEFLTRVLGKRASFKDQFQHFHNFSATILDRVFLFTGQENIFDIEVHGEDIIQRQLDAGNGCILLGSHLGSFEVLRTLGVKRPDVSLKVLMYGDHTQNIVRLLNRLNPKIASSVISLGSPDALLEVKECLDGGGLIGMLGDRVAQSEKQIKCNLLGEGANFPTGPMLLAETLNVPVVLFYGLYKGGRRYDIHFELLTDAPKLGQDLTKNDRENYINQLTCRYVERLEYYTRQSPYNWFNFYDFWRAS